MPSCRPAIVALLLFAAGCSRETPSGTVVVNMYDNAYSPPRVRIPEGGRVVFKNLGRNQHHAVALDEGWSTAADFGTLVMEQGDVAEVVFD
ncbi:MAG: plastocyanin, partial [Thermoanaerobaculia bacterium]